MNRAAIARQPEVAMVDRVPERAGRAKKIPRNASPPRWRYESMRPVHLAEAIAARPIAWLVLSPLEWHGEAIAFGADVLVGRAIAERAWEELGGVLLPPLHVGVETEYKAWEEEGLTSRWGLEVITKQRHPGSLYARPLTLELILRDQLSALQREGFKLAVIVTGHGAVEHIQVLRETCDRPWAGMHVLEWNAADAAHNLPAPLQFQYGNDSGHGDVIEASLVGAIDPSLVDLSRFGRHERDRQTGLHEANAAAVDFARGRAILEHNAKQLAAKVSAALGQMNR